MLLCVIMLWRKVQWNLFITTLDTTTKFVILTIWLAQKPSLKRWKWSRNYAGTLLFNTSSNICFGYFLELPHRGNSNKYPKHMFYEEIRIKHSICCISFCSLRILYNSKFILMAISLETNVVVVKRGHCICRKMICFILYMYKWAYACRKIQFSFGKPQRSKSAGSSV